MHYGGKFLTNGENMWYEGGNFKYFDWVDRYCFGDPDVDDVSKDLFLLDGSISSQPIAKNLIFDKVVGLY